MTANRYQPFLTRILTGAIFIGLGYAFFRYLLPIVLPFLLGFLLAMLLRPQAIRLANRTHMPQTLASICVLLVVYCFSSLLIVLLMTQLYAALRTFAEQFPFYLENDLLPLIEKWTVQLENWQMNLTPITSDLLQVLAAQLPSVLSSFSEQLRDAAAAFLRGIPVFALNVSVTVVSSFFFAADYRTISDFILRQVPPRGKKILCIAKHFSVGTLFQLLRAHGLILLCTFGLLLIGFLLLGVNHAAALAAVVALIDLLPILGVGLILIPWALFYLLRHSYEQAIGFLLLFAAIEICRNLLEPHVLGHQTGLRPAVSFVCMLLGLRLFGAIGLFVLPLLVTVLKKLNDEDIVHFFR